ncbi:DUF6538 domain-containing protein [Paraburkholderia guartelaensis]|uniref:DUF6538 domain-containing protein n=1 Tax=Paraburkholderia guartelaensis TaxID=2546446 RepID=UPI003CCC6047
MSSSGVSVTATRYLLRRGSRYYYRRKIRAEFQEVICRALGTSDRREAEALVREQAHFADLEWERLRQPGGLTRWAVLPVRRGKPPTKPSNRWISS